QDPGGGGRSRRRHVRSHGAAREAARSNRFDPKRFEYPAVRSAQARAHERGFRHRVGTVVAGRLRVTLAHVAARAGVSRSTASLAFSGAGPVAEATRQRVLAAAAALGYAGPDPLARSLRQGRSGVVGVAIGDRLLDAFRDPVAVA